MAHALLGWNNRITEAGAALAASSEQAGLGVTQLQNAIGDPSTAWQTPSGVTSASLVVTTASGASTWRAFLLARTNLTSAATVRWRVGPTEALVEETPTFDLVFTSGAITPPAGYSFTRASKAWAFNSAGVLTEHANNTLRFSYDPVTLECLGVLREEARTNAIRNPRGEGASAPSTNPTYWNADTTDSLGPAIVGTGTEAGIPYVDIRFFGVSGTGEVCYVDFEAATQIAAAVGQSWTSTVFLRLVAGSFGTGVLRSEIDERNSGGTLLTTGSQAHSLPTNAVLGSQRFTYTRTLNQATTAYVQPRIAIAYGSGLAVDFTVRIGIPQIEQGTIASSPMMPTVGSPAAFTRAVEACVVTGLNIDPAVGYSVFVDSTVNDDSGAGASVSWSLTPASNAFADTHYEVRSSTTATLTLLDSDHGNAPTYPAKSLAWGSAGKSAVSVGPAGAKLQVNALSLASIGWVATSNGPLTRLGIGGAAWSVGAGPTTGIQTMRRFTFYGAKQLSTGQLLALATTGSTQDAAALAYDSGTVAAGVVPGFQQSVIAAPAEVSGRVCRLDVADTANPDGFLNIPLAYAGPVWQPTRNVSSATTQGRDDMTTETRTRGGQEYPVLHYIVRRWEIDLQGVEEAELWLHLDSLDNSARDGRNVLFVPDPASTDVGRAAVFGRLRARTDASFFAGGPDLRAWKATISERL